MTQKILAIVAVLAAAGLLCSCAPAPRRAATTQEPSHPSVQPSGAEAAVREASAAAQAAILACEVNTQFCVADALDLYAATLAKLAPQLPPELQSLPAIVATAAKRVRTAKTKAEAVGAIKTAIVEVHKRISLVKADDAPTQQAATREGTLVVDTLQTAGDRLEKAAGL